MPDEVGYYLRRRHMETPPRACQRNYAQCIRAFFPFPLAVLYTVQQRNFAHVATTGMLKTQRTSHVHYTTVQLLARVQKDRCVNATCLYR